MATVIYLILIFLFCELFVFYMAFRPLMRNWGSTKEERIEPFPGDEKIERFDLSSTRAITIEALPKEVWPLMVQMKNSNKYRIGEIVFVEPLNSMVWAVDGQSLFGCKIGFSLDYEVRSVDNNKTRILARTRFYCSGNILIRYFILFFKDILEYFSIKRRLKAFKKTIEERVKLS